MVAYGATVTLAWDPNTEDDLAGYKIHYGTASGEYSYIEDVGNITQYTLADLDDGVTYYLAATAYDHAGNESAYSVELVHTTGYPNHTFEAENMTIEAENMLFTGGGNNHAITDGWALLGPGYLSATVEFAAETVKFEVVAKGSYAGGAWPIMEVRIDQTPVGAVTVDASDWKTFEIQVSITPGTHEVAFAFINDYWKDPDDRNLYIDKVNITVAGGNLPPEAAIIADGINGIVPLLVNFDGRGSHDPDGEIISYDWYFGDGTIDSEDTISHTFSDTGVYTVTLTVTDDQGATSSDTIQIIASSGDNQPPIANAGPDQTANEGAVVKLKGNNSSDPAGSIAAYSWNQISGPPVQISNSGQIEANFLSPNVVPSGDTLIFQLIVTDNEGLQATDTCSVYVTREPVTDSDGDGVPDDQDEFPNDADEYLDTDGDGVGNNADTDDDNDGMPDVWELLYGLDPLENDADDDPDGDEISNINEYDLGSEPNYNESNFKPDPPQLLNPGNDEIVGLTPLLETDEFYDPDDDVHSWTQWKISRVDDDFCVFDVTTSSSLTALKVPKLILEEDTDYIWQVKFFDNQGTQGTASEWSEAGYFTTEFLEQDSDGNGVLQDLDGNGILDHQEVDTTIDLDNDGIMDRDQEDIKCVVTETGGFKIGISIREAENADSIVSIQSETPGDTDLLLSAPDGPNFLAFGLIHFKLLVKEPGDEVSVTIYLSKAAYDDGIWYKYDPVNDEWFDYSDFVDFSADRKIVHLTLTDGGFGDADGIENGVIVDPLALRTASDHSSGSNSSGSDSFIEDVTDKLNPSSSGMCFISAADSRSADRQAFGLWREIRSRDLSILFILMLLAYIGKEVSLRIRQNRRLGRRTSLMEGWRNSQG
jgi:PKD repeat protein